MLWNLRLKVCLVALTLSISAAAHGEERKTTRTVDVIYGRKYGLAMTMDVFTPDEPNGLGVVFAVSGGWFSSREMIAQDFVDPLLERGYTVFAVVHGSQPKFAIPEILTDMHRAVRYIRHHAKKYDVDPERLGIFGGSAGGHLSLMQGVAGTPGDPEAKDPVDRQSSRVQAVACFFPPTDFLNYGKEGELGIGRGKLKAFRAPFDFEEWDEQTHHFVEIDDEEKLVEIGRQISPVTHVSADDPPMLIVHGDADELVPIQQAKLMIDKLKEEGVEAELVTKPGAAHGWKEMAADVSIFADWFDKHLAAAESHDHAHPDDASAVHSDDHGQDDNDGAEDDAAAHAEAHAAEPAAADDDHGHADEAK